MEKTYWQNTELNELRMTFKEWLNLEYNELRRITENITSNHRLTDDLFHEVILQLLNKSKDLDKIPDKEKKYFFISVIRLNFYSKTSRFHYKIRKPTDVWFTFDERDEGKEEDEGYIDKPDLNWVLDELKTIHWLRRTLFEFWIEEGTITKVSEKTKINKNTCGGYIREVKEILQQRWDEQNK